MKNYELIKKNLFFFLIVILLSLIIADRPDSLGDTLTYKLNFYNIFTYYESNYEPIFKYISRLIYFIYPDHFFYFFCLAFIFNYYWFKSSILISNYLKFNYYINITLVLIFSLISSWYFSATTNGLRQGLSLVFMYYGMINFIVSNKIIKSLVFILISVLTHYSSLLFFPFIFLFFLNLNKLLFLFIVISIFYPLGLNEKIVEFLSNLIGLELYSSVKNYLESTNEQYWIGFQFKFYLYSIFWAIFFLIIDKSNNFKNILKVYIIALIVYFVFGFGAFSNRFGFMAWLFLPLLQASLFYRMIFLRIKDKNLLLLILLALFFYASIYLMFMYEYFRI